MSNTFDSLLLTMGPARYYTLNDKSGTSCHDSSVNAINGTYSNSPTLGVAGLVKGDVSTAVGFNAASSQGVSISNFTGLYGAGQDLTMLILTNQSTFAQNGGGSTQRIFQLNMDGNYTAQIVADSPSLLGCQVVEAGSSHTITHSGFSTGTVYMVALTYRHASSLPTLYVNGIAVSNNGGKGDGNYGDGNTGFCIAQRTDGAGYVTGTLQKAALFKSVLSATQISNLYNAAIAANLVGSGLPRRGGNRGRNRY